MWGDGSLPIVQHGEELVVNSLMQSPNVMFANDEHFMNLQ